MKKMNWRLFLSILALLCAKYMFAATDIIINPIGTDFKGDLYIKGSGWSAGSSSGGGPSSSNYVVRQTAKDSIWKYNIYIKSDFSGVVTLDSLNTNCIIHFEGTGTLNIKGGNYKNVYNSSTGTVNILSGTIDDPDNSTVVNSSTGIINIGGGADTTYIISRTTNSGINACVYQSSSGKDLSNRINILDKANLLATGNGYGIYNNSYGGVQVKGGSITSSVTAIYNKYGGALTISGGNIRSINGYALDLFTTSYNYGELTISGGVISSDKNYAINNTLSTPIKITGGLITTSTKSAIYNYSNGSSYNPINISGGTVHSSSRNSTILNMQNCNIIMTGGSVISENDFAICNNSTGIVTIGGGIDTAKVICRSVSQPAETYSAVYQNSNGIGSIKILDKALIQGINGSNGVVNISDGIVTINGGTIISDNGDAVKTLYGKGQLNVTAGKIISGSGNAINHRTQGVVNISGGTISSSSGTALYNYSSATVTISGGSLSSNSGYGIYNNSTGSLAISKGTINSTSNYGIYNNSTGGITFTGGSVGSDSKKSIYINSTSVNIINGVYILRVWTGTSDYPYYINGNYNLGNTILGNNYKTIGLIGSAENTARNLGYKFINTSTNYTRGTSTDASKYIKSASSTVNIINPSVLAVLNINQPTNGSIITTSGIDTVVSGTAYLISENKTVNLKAIPLSGYFFSNWTGTSNNYSNPNTVVLNADKNVSVSFLPNTTDIAENQLEENVNIFPNPISAGSMINIKCYKNNESIFFKLIDINGSCLSTGYINGNCNQIKAPLTTGIYLLQIKNKESNTIWMKQLIVK